MTTPAAGEDALASFTIAEVEFMAEETPVTIRPNFRMPELKGMGGAWGPFRPAMPVQVPLWLAVTLRKRGKCSIQAPPWMEVAALQQRLEEELSQGRFGAMPDHYMEVATLLLNTAPDDIPERGRVRALLQDIWDVRAGKARLGVRRLDKVDVVDVKNMTQLEMAAIRPFFVRAIDHYRFFAADEPA